MVFTFLVFILEIKIILFRCYHQQYDNKFKLNAADVGKVNSKFPGSVTLIDCKELAFFTHSESLQFLQQVAFIRNSLLSYDLFRQIRKIKDTLRMISGMYNTESLIYFYCNYYRTPCLRSDDATQKASRISNVM